MPKTTPPSATGMDRRAFLAASGGLLLAFTLPDLSRRGRAAAAGLPAGVTSSAINAWIRIGSDESITILVGSSEMGQGVMSSLPQIVAEDLMVAWSRVRAEAAPANMIYANPGSGGQVTGGSMSVMGYYQPLRLAGAAARDMLIAAAAQTFGVPVSACQAINGTVVVTGTNRVLTYGQLASLAATMPVPQNPPLVPDNALRLIGQPVQRLDLPSKTDGSAQFGIDVQVPGMVFAAIKHCPVIGGTVAGVPATPAGVIAIVSLDTAVAVVADNTWKAMTAAAMLPVKWAYPASAGMISSQIIHAQAQWLMTKGTALVAESVGNPTGALAGAAKKLDVTYELPYLAHACMEPLNCTVSITPNSCDVWAPTQAQTDVASTAATITGLAPNQIQVHTTFLGGGLGRKFEMDYITQALRIAKAIGKPVKLTWSREEDFGNDQYRPMALVRVQAGLDASGNVAAWLLRNVSPSILGQRGWLPPNTADGQAVEGAIGLTYTFGSRLTDWASHPAAVPVGFWRSVGNSINAFAVESAIDELAAIAALDPLAFRQKLLAADPRSLAVLNAAASLGGWGQSLPTGHAQGIAIVSSFNSIAAQVVEISQPTAGMVTVHRVSCAVDCGKAINPDTVEAQMQGGIVHALNAALWGRVTFNYGVASARNFDTYRMLRLREMPHVDVKIIQSGAAIGGIGEVGVPPLAPALANAYFRLTGKRIRSLPMFPTGG